MNTPVTDAEIWGNDHGYVFVPAEIARQLERDRARLIAHLSKDAEILENHRLSAKHITDLLSSLEAK